MTLDRARYLASLETDGAALAGAGRAGLAAPVPGCPGWDVARLLDHLTKIYSRTALIVGQQLAQPPAAAPAGRTPTGGDPVQALQASLAGCIRALAGTDPTAPAWNFTGRDQTAAFWARRMAHETAVHRVDGQQAHGPAEPVPTDLAADGIDEYVEVIAPRQASSGVPAELVDRPVLLSATDAGRQWLLVLGTGGLRATEPSGESPAATTGPAPEATVAAPASTLLLALYGRQPWPAGAVTGDPDLPAAWTSGLPIRAR